MQENAALMPLFDAHCHWQDQRLIPYLSAVLPQARALGLRRAVVNGTCERDWSSVLDLAARDPLVIPSLGLHPWRIGQRSSRWLSTLRNRIESSGAAVGEIGLDRWMRGFDAPDQEKVFADQLALAAGLNRPASIHCLKAWGRLLEILQGGPVPACGFLLHSYSGPAEMIAPFADLGAYFSISGYFAHPRKERQRQVFRHIPPARLLIETDAPDMLPPHGLPALPLGGPDAPLNHPANIAAIYQFAAGLTGMKTDELAAVVTENFARLFGLALSKSPPAPFLLPASPGAGGARWRPGKV